MADRFDDFTKVCTGTCSRRVQMHGMHFLISSCERFVCIASRPAEVAGKDAWWRKSIATTSDFM